MGADPKPELEPVEWSDEFRYYTPSARAGVLFIRSLTDDEVLAAARDPHSSARAKVADEMGPGTNPSWISGQCIEDAYRRRLIDEIELDYLLEHGERQIATPAAELGLD